MIRHKKEGKGGRRVRLCEHGKRGEGGGESMGVGCSKKPCVIDE